MIVCGACGKSVEADDAFCGHCGSPLGADAEPVTREEAELGTRRLLVAGALVVAGVIVGASVVWRGFGPPDPFADPATQREAVERFHAAVVSARWADVYALTAQPPARTPNEFAALMGDRVDVQGIVEAVDIESMRLHRSRTVPLLEVRERVRTAGGARDVVSFYAWDDDRWLFAFSSDG